MKSVNRYSLYRQSSIWLAVVLSVWLSASSVNVWASSAPKVVTDISPTHSLVSMVMGELGTPDLLMDGSQSPHDYALRPSNAKTLAQADLVVWMHPELTPWLETGLASLAPETPSTILMEASGITLLRAREQLDFLHEAGEEEGSHGHDHGHSLDPHGWLDPINALVFLRVITDTLVRMDSANASVYEANAKLAQQEIEKTRSLLNQELSHIESLPFLIMHDSIQYFERRFSLSVLGSVSNTDAVDAGPRRVRQIRELLKESEAQCVFAEVQENNTILSTITEGLEVRLGLLDPVGVQLTPGADLYSMLLIELATSLAECLKQ